MRLAAWLKRENRSLEWLSEQVGRESSVLSKLTRGLIRPSNEVAAAIHRLTDGAVTSIDHEDAYLERLAASAPKPVAASDTVAA